MKEQQKKSSEDKSLENAEGWPYYSEDEVDAVNSVLRSGRVNQWSGDRVRTFERNFEAKFEHAHAVAVANGTVALELALRALDIQKGDEVIVTSRSFIASASCVSLIGAKPIFSEVDRNSQNITVDDIARLVTPKTKAIIPVHLAGWPCDMPEIMKLAKKNFLLVIEDCAQAIGAKIDDVPVGSFGDAATFSFCQDKIISTGGEGGMVVFKGGQTAEFGRSFRDHGKEYSKIISSTGANSFAYVHDAIGTNYRMTELQAAIGIIQLTKLDEWISQRQKNAEIWSAALSPLHCIRVPWPASNVQHAFYRFYAFLTAENLRTGITRDDILIALNEAGIRAFTGSCPEIYREKAFDDLDVETKPIARELGETSLAFEVHPTLDPSRLKDVAKHAADIISSFQKE